MTDYLCLIIPISQMGAGIYFLKRGCYICCELITPLPSDIHYHNGPVSECKLFWKFEFLQEMELPIMRPNVYEGQC